MFTEIEIIFLAAVLKEYCLQQLAILTTREATDEDVLRGHLSELIMTKLTEAINEKRDIQRPVQ